MTVKQVGEGVYAINGLPKRSQLLVLPAGQISVDESPLITLSGGDVQNIIENIDNYITNINSQLLDDVMLLYSDQTASGEKTFVDDLRVASNLLPSGSTVAIGASGTEFDELWVNTIHADSILVEGSPGLKLGHDGTRGYVDSTQDNDIDFRRNGLPFLRLEDGLAFFNTDVAILQNLSVSGTTTTLNTEQLLVEDNLVTLNSTHSGAPILDAGIEINRGSQPNALILWDEFNDQWEVGVSGATDKITVESELLAASGTLQADIDTRATYAQLVATSGVLQTDINNRVLRSGDTMTGFLTLSANPTSSLHASTKSYTDTQDNLRVLKSGDTMTGDLLASSTSVDLGSSSNRFGNVHAAVFQNATGDVTLAGGDDVVVRAAGGSGDIFLQTGGSNTRWIVSSAGALYPNTDAFYDIGLTSRACSRVFSRNLLSDTTLGLGSANAVRWNINTGGTLYPATNGTYLLGGSSNHISAAYINTVTTVNNTSMRVYNGLGTNGRLMLGVSSGPDYTTGAFLELFGISYPGGSGDVRLGSATGGRVLFYSGGTAGINDLRWGIDNNGTLSNYNSGGNHTYLNMYAAGGSQTQAIQFIRTNSASVNSYAFLTCQAQHTTTPDNKFHLLGNGNLRLDGSASSPAADYAEYFELKDGEAAIEVGETVVLDGDRIRKFDSNVDTVTDIVGVVRHTDTSTFTGNAPLNWPSRYQKTEFGEILLSTSGTPLENPDFDPEQEYIPREERPEWYKIGMLGQVAVKPGATKHPNWIKMKDLSGAAELWFIR
jgi:hypothetical protein